MPEKAPNLTAGHFRRFPVPAHRRFGIDFFPFSAIILPSYEALDPENSRFCMKRFF